MFNINQTSRPSLQILNALYQYDDFMQSIKTLVDIGCGVGEDLEWWATATTRDDDPQPLNIQCVGVDLAEKLAMAHKHRNVTYQRVDFETDILPPKNLFDVLWCHDAFQYCINPITTLSKWRDISSDGAMLVLAVPQTIHVSKKLVSYQLSSGVFYHHTLVSLIYMLALTGWDCRGGFFQQRPGDSWIRAVVYKSKQPPQDPKTTSWYHLMEMNMLPESADGSVHAHGYLRQQDLVLPWIDKSYSVMSQV